MTPYNFAGSHEDIAAEAEMAEIRDDVVDSRYAGQLRTHSVFLFGAAGIFVSSALG